MTTRSSRRNAPAEFQQLSYEVSKEKRPKKSNKKTPNANINREGQDIFQQKDIGLQNNKSFFIAKNGNNHQRQIGNSIKQTPQQKQDTATCQQSKQVQTRNSRKDLRKAINPEPISINTHHEIILLALNKLTNHELYFYLDETKLKPTTSSQVKKVRQKIKGIYTINQFQADFDKIFRIFYEQAFVDESVFEGIKTLQTQVNELLSVKSENHQEPVQNVKDSSNFFSKSKSKAARNVASTSKSKGKRQYASSIAQHQSFQAETTSNQAKKIRKQAIIAPRSKLSKISLNEIANLGQSIMRLPSQDLAVICFKYGECKEESSTYYRLQLQKMPKQTFFELQAYVKTIYKQKDLKYGEVQVADEDDDFVIDSDGSETK